MEFLGTTAPIAGGSLYFVTAGNGESAGAVWSISGTQVTKISTTYIDSLLSGLLTSNNDWHTVYHLNGHDFLSIGCADLSTALQYDISLGSWAEFSSNLVNATTSNTRGLINAHYSNGQFVYFLDTNGHAF